MRSSKTVFETIEMALEDSEFADKMNRMIFDYLNEQKLEKIAKKFSKECGTDMDKKFKRPNLKKQWLNFLKQADERLVYFCLLHTVCTYT